MMGYQREGFVEVVVVATINLLLTVILTPQFGIIGAAVSTLISVVLRSVIVAALVHRKLGFWPLLWSA
jgi:O-antigen/teichoic acid export membrane protein